VARNAAEENNRWQQNKENNETNEADSPTPINENDNDTTDKHDEEYTTPSKSNTDLTDTPSDDIMDNTPIANETNNEIKESIKEHHTTVNEQRKPKSNTRTETGVDVTNHPDHDKEITDDISLNITDGEMVRTHPSQTTCSPESSMPPPTDFLSSQSLQLPGLPNTYNPNIASNSLSDQDDVDNESIASDMTDLSQTDTQNHQRDPTEISDFLDDVLNSKMLIPKCEEFCPNLHSLAKQLKSYNRSNPDLTKNQRARIHKYVVKIRAYIKTTGRKYCN
jgi:hypothetical protein